MKKYILLVATIFMLAACGQPQEDLVAAPDAEPTPILVQIESTLIYPFNLDAAQFAAQMQEEGYAFVANDESELADDISDVTIALVGTDALEEIRIAITGTGTWMYEQSAPWWVFLQRAKLGKTGNAILAWLQGDYNSGRHTEYFDGYEIEADMNRSGETRLTLTIRPAN